MPIAINCTPEKIEIATIIAVYPCGRSGFKILPIISIIAITIPKPEKSTPIIIENHTYVAKEGQCIFFLASQYHSVGLNDCDERCAIVGNISYRF